MSVLSPVVQEDIQDLEYIKNHKDDELVDKEEIFGR